MSVSEPYKKPIWKNSFLPRRTVVAHSGLIYLCIVILLVGCAVLTYFVVKLYHAKYIEKKNLWQSVDPKGYTTVSEANSTLHVESPIDYKKEKSGNVNGTYTVVHSENTTIFDVTISGQSVAKSDINSKPFSTINSKLFYVTTIPFSIDAKNTNQNSSLISKLPTGVTQFDIVSINLSYETAILQS